MMSLKSNRRRSLTNGLKRLKMNQQASMLSNKSITSTTEAPEESCIKVILRSRPFNKREMESGYQVVSLVDEKVLIFDPVQVEDDFFFQGRKQGLRDINKKVNKNHKFMFNHVFDGSVSNEDIYTESIRSLLDNLLSGFNCSVFAYGATGAGKTFTMLGSEACPGLTYLIVKDLFQRIEDITDKTFDLQVSYLEVYNETVKDLFRPSPPLLVRDDCKGVTVSGLSFQKPTSAEELLTLLHFGNKNRTQHPTDANSESSRSHAVFQIYLKIKDRVGGLSEKVHLSKMSLIDLAGSERACVASNHGKDRQREGANINQSLLALGSCINALADKNSKSQHIPYRNSKLTRILKDSLGGNCKTIMIAAVGPSSLTYEDTYNTLKYADRAKGIKVTLNQNMTKIAAHMSGYKTIIDSLQKEVLTLKRKLEDQEIQSAKHAKVCTNDCAVQTLCTGSIPTPESHCNRVETCSWNPPIVVQQHVGLNSNWVRTVDTLFQQLTKIGTDILSCESLIRENKASLYWKTSAYKRSCALTVDNERLMQSKGKFENFTNCQRVKESRLLEQRDKLLNLFAGKKEALTAIWECETSEAGKLYARNLYLELELLCEHIRIKHVMEISVNKFNEIQKERKLCEQSLLMTRKLQLILKGHNFLSTDLILDFDTLLKQVESREVAWADVPRDHHPLQQEFIQHLTLPNLFNQEEGSSFNLLHTERPLATFKSPDRKHLPASPLKFSQLVSPQRSTQTVISTTLTSPPPQSGVISPQVSTFRSRQGSPHPNKPQKSTRELLEMLNNDNEATARRSLEETYGSTSQVVITQPSQSQPLAMPFPQHLGNVTFSPDGFHDDLSCSFGYATSTPSEFRKRSIFSSTAINFAEPLEMSLLYCHSKNLQTAPQAGDQNMNMTIIPAQELDSHVFTPSHKSFTSPVPTSSTTFACAAKNQFQATFMTSRASPFESRAPAGHPIGTSFTIPDKSPLPSILKFPTASVCPGTSTNHYNKEKVGLIQPIIRGSVAVSEKSRPRSSVAIASTLQQGTSGVSKVSFPASGIRPISAYRNGKQNGKENSDIGKMGPPKISSVKKTSTSNLARLSSTKTTSHNGFQKTKSTSCLKPQNK